MSEYKFEKFHRLTQDEFVLLKGTELAEKMLTNKWYTDCADVLDILDANATGTWCSVPYKGGWLLYLASVGDIILAKQYVQPGSEPAPAIQGINIGYEHS
jgi:hypothetical protein|tara:strand:+ start:649 stop:948 length:300 start_codon:yes stop_codon:yes gene_type:complete